MVLDISEYRKKRHRTTVIANRHGFRMKLFRYPTALVHVDTVVMETTLHRAKTNLGPERKENS